MSLAPVRNTALPLGVAERGNIVSGCLGEGHSRDRQVGNQLAGSSAGSPCGSPGLHWLQCLKNLPVIPVKSRVENRSKV